MLKSSLVPLPLPGLCLQQLLLMALRHGLKEHFSLAFELDSSSGALGGPAAQIEFKWFRFGVVLLKRWTDQMIDR